MPSTPPLPLLLPALLLALVLGLAPCISALPQQPFVPALSMREVKEQRFIRDTPANQEYFDNAQAIVSVGVFNKSAACETAGLDDIVDCIRICNKPGERKRGRCCCVAEGGDFRIGLAGSCRYKQVVLNFSNSEPPFMQYESRPPALSAGQAYFDAQSCDATNQNVGGQPCGCELVWSLNIVSILEFTPEPTPSASPSQVSPTPKPSFMAPKPSKSPAPSPAASMMPQPSKEPGGGAVVAPPAEVSSAASPTSQPPNVAERDPTPLPPPGGIGSGTTGGATPSPESDEDSPDASSADATDEAGAAEAEPSDDGGGDICVDAKWLAARGHARIELVHAAHRFAPVLCPDNGLPCGTQNHAVRLANGEVVSYERLCERAEVKCSEDSMEVNSVWSHRWTETEHEGGVRLTMLDVRYPGAAQKALHRVMRALRTVGAA